jgi:hypothetical protein
MSPASVKQLFANFTMVGYRQIRPEKCLVNSPIGGPSVFGGIEKIAIQASDRLDRCLLLSPVEPKNTVLCLAGM